MKHSHTFIEWFFFFAVLPHSCLQADASGNNKAWAWGAATAAIMNCQRAGYPACQQLIPNRQGCVAAFSKLQPRIRRYIGKVASTALCPPCRATSVNVQEPNESESTGVRQVGYLTL